MIPELSSISFECKSFEDLSNSELYSILQLRQEVFVVEQDCPYLDCDGKDIEAWHVCAYKNNELLGYTRLLAKGISYPDYSSISRVVTNQKLRKTGLGKALMIYSIDRIKEFFPKTIIKISSQVYILDFYRNLGFIKIGDEYLEDNIPHHAMILDLEN